MNKKSVLVAGLAAVLTTAVTAQNGRYLVEYARAGTAQQTILLARTIDDSCSFFCTLPSTLEDRLPNEFREGTFIKYYETDGFGLSGSDSLDLQRYGRWLEEQGIEAAIIYAGADSRHDTLHNDTLSTKRAMGVLRVLKAAYPALEAGIIPYGERMPVCDQSSTEGLQRNRYAKIVPVESVLSQVVEEGMGAYVLVDCSSSTENVHVSQGRTLWEFVQHYPYPERTRLFGFSDCNGGGVQERRSITQVSPCGRTPLYASLYQLIIQHSLSRTTVLVITDGQDNIGGRTPEDIVALAREKAVRINMVTVNVDPLSTKSLKYLAKGTGGDFFFCEALREYRPAKQ